MTTCSISGMLCWECTFSILIRLPVFPVPIIRSVAFLWLRSLFGLPDSDILVFWSFELRSAAFSKFNNPGDVRRPVVHPEAGSIAS